MGTISIVLSGLFVMHLRFCLPSLFSACLLILALSLPSAWAASGEGPWTRTPQADVRLLAGQDTPSADGRLSAGLEFRLQDGWKVYWRSPGDAGYPPALDWQASDNLAAPPDISWPYPHRFEILGIQTLGYKQQVIFPLAVQVQDPSRPLALRLAADYLICSTICVPGRAEVTLDVPAHQGSVTLTDAAHAIETFRALVPPAVAAGAPLSGNGLTITDSVLETGADGTPRLALALTASPPLGADADLYVEGQPAGEPTTTLMSGVPAVTRLDGGQRAILRAPLTAPLPDSLTITVGDGARGLEWTRAIPPAGTLPDPASGNETSLWLSMIAIALLGGVVLNLMPCVLPVLSLKVLAFVGHHQQAGEPTPRTAFLASAVGIISAFLLLAGSLIALKSAGAAVGWGIQFQNPWFLGGMVVLVLLFAANLSGLFEIRLPGRISDLAGSAHSTRLSGHFMTGLFATLLATPCSAPFLGTAVGFALARGPLEILAIFVALGLGMAAPYLLIAAVPRLAARLPRPGRWMLTVKKVLALALLGTAVWLGSVLWSILTPPDANNSSTSRFAWQPFDTADIARQVAAGKVVFVDVTADWCITCKVNKAAVVDRDPVAAALAAPSVVAMRADWTRPNPAISAYLASFGRYGIPFNVVYGPKAPQGIALPELLTSQAVVDALTAAGQ